MTTHHQHSPLSESDPMEPSNRQDYGTEQAQPSSERMTQPGAAMDADAAQRDSTALDDTAAEMHTGTGTDASAGQVASARNDHDLFADDELVGLRARWDIVQASFVDDPKDCVQKADGLVADLVEQLTRSFSHSRSQLEEQWARGEDASTEDLRITLKRYREFFDRLLAV